MKPILHKQMIMNYQSVTITLKKELSLFLEQEYSISDFKPHAENVYLMKLPLDGEKSQLSTKEKQFVFKEELSLLSEQYSIEIEFNPNLYSLFFQENWNGVIYLLDENDTIPTDN